MSASNSPSVFPSRQPKVLIVEDDDVDREKLRRVLARTGVWASVSEARSGRDAVDTLRREIFQCVILDYHLKDMLGTELLPHIRAHSQDPCPVIMITGQGDERLVVKAMQEGVYDYFPKDSLRPMQLRSAIDICLRRAELEQQLRESQRRLEHLSLFDGLTGLPNRALFFDRFEQAVLTASRNCSRFAVLMMDLDLFKEINDCFGHEAGDAVLTAIGRRLKQALRKSDTIARLGGDEFAGILLNISSIEDVISIAEKIIAVVREPIALASRMVTLGISIGIALFPLHGKDKAMVLANADLAMYRAKRGSRGYEIHNEAIVAPRRVGYLAGQLAQAIESQQLFLEFQPIINLATRDFVCAEALVRWRNPEDGVIPPAQFVPQAERSAVIGPLTYAVIDMALDQVQCWQMAGWNIPVAVNLSPRMLDDETLPRQILRALEVRGLGPAVLSLELTETALMTNPERAKPVLRQLADAGIKISIDDFGTGYTSLRYLQDFDFNEIKIDRLFVNNIRPEGREASIIRSICTLAEGFGIGVVAEGIENPEWCETLIALGCDKGQGFGIGYPMESLEEWLQRWQSSLTAVFTLQVPRLS